MENSSNLILPTHKGTESAAGPADVETINIDKNALVTVGSTSVDNLEAALVALKSSRPALAVQIRAHRELPVQKLAEVMDAVKRAGITKIAFIGTSQE